MNVRRATAEEVPEIVVLARQSFDAAVAPLYGEDGHRTFTEFASTESMLKRMGENYVTYVAEREGKLVGMAQVRDGHHLAMLFVMPEAQRKGVGRRLLEFVIAECTSDTITVASSPNSEGAYVRFGFTRIADEKVDRGIRFVMMALNRKNPNKSPDPAPRAMPRISSTGVDGPK